MRQRKRLREFSSDYADAILRFPLTNLLLLAAFCTNTFAIYQGEELYGRLLITFLLGAGISSVLQLIYERFYTIPTIRYLFMGVTLVLSIIYYLIVGTDPWRIDVAVKTLVLFFILLIAFLWIPSIKSRINFNQSFMAAFKAFFAAAFFSIVIFLGVVIVIAATNLLLMEVQPESFAYAANLVFILLMPIQFLTLIPHYPNQEEMSDLVEEGPIGPGAVKERDEALDTSTNQSKESNQTAMDASLDAQTNSVNSLRSRREDKLQRQITPVKFLEALITYVIIPLTAVFTIILILYILMNITGEFWTDNLMEPLLVSYSITVIIVYLLASSIHNTITIYFRKIFPKVLVVVVLFQTVSSLLRTAEVGITYGRYYAIMFGVFAIIAGIIFSIKPIRSNGLIAPVLIILSLISILPFIDAFSIGRISQIHRLESTLVRNDMLVDQTIIPKVNISEEDKKTIISAMRYLNEMNYSKEVEWLQGYTEYYDFKAIFGFQEYEQEPDEVTEISVYREHNTPIPITGYDYMIRVNLNQEDRELSLGQFEKDGNVYHIKLTNKSKQFIGIEAGGNELIRFDTSKIFDSYTSEGSLQVTAAKTEDMTFTEDNTEVILTIVADSIYISKWQDSSNKQADTYLLVKIK